MKDYGKWLVIGLLLGIGISLGYQASEYYIDQYIVAPARGPTKDIEYLPKGINVSGARVAKTAFSYQGTVQLINSSGKDYVGFVVTAELHDSRGLLEVCKGIESSVGKTEVLVTLLCNASNEKHPEVQLKNIEVVEGVYYKST